MLRNSPIALLLALAFALAACSPEGGAPSQVVKIAKRTDGPISIIVVGDTMADDLVLPYLKKYGTGYPFEAVKPILLGADLVNANLEVAVAQKCERAKNKKFAYAMRPEGLTGMKQAGINLVALANNHTLDCGPQGLKETLHHLDQAGILHYGAGVGEDRHRGVVVQIDGTKIGFVGWYNYKLEIGQSGTAHISEQAVRQDVGALKHQADVIVATFHWGKNYSPQIDAKQTSFARLAIDSGAHAVIGHHPHIPQPVALYKGRPIVYSVGNFAFATGNNRAHEAFAARLVLEKKKIARLEMIPLFVKNRDPKVLWQVKRATGDRARRTLSALVRTSAPFDAAFLVQDETAVLNLN